MSIIRPLTMLSVPMVYTGDRKTAAAGSRKRGRNCCWEPKGEEMNDAWRQYVAGQVCIGLRKKIGLRKRIGVRKRIGENG